MLPELGPWIECLSLMVGEFTYRSGLGPRLYDEFGLTIQEVAILSRAQGAILAAQSEAARQKT